MNKLHSCVRLLVRVLVASELAHVLDRRVDPTPWHGCTSLPFITRAVDLLSVVLAVRPISMALLTSRTLDLARPDLAHPVFAVTVWLIRRVVSADDPRRNVSLLSTARLIVLTYPWSAAALFACSLLAAAAVCIAQLLLITVLAFVVVLAVNVKLGSVSGDALLAADFDSIRDGSASRLVGITRAAHPLTT